MLALLVVAHVVLQGGQVPLTQKALRLLVEGDLWLAFHIHLHGACPEKRHGRMQQGAAAVCVPTIVPCAWLHELDRHVRVRVVGEVSLQDGLPAMLVDGLWHAVRADRRAHVAAQLLQPMASLCGLSHWGAEVGRR